MEYDLITFDCYGTLIDWETGITTAFQSMVNSMGKSVCREEIISLFMQEEPVVEAEQYRLYRDVLNETARRMAAHLGIELTPSAAAFLPESLKSWEPFPDTNEALKKLAERYSLGLLSNVDDDLLAVTRRKFPVQFDLIVTAQQVRSYKPGRAHFDECRERSMGKRQLHCAQSYFHDVVPCVELGIPVVWVNRNSEPAPENGQGPLDTVSDLAALAGLLT